MIEFFRVFYDIVDIYIKITRYKVFFRFLSKFQNEQFSPLKMNKIFLFLRVEIVNYEIHSEFSF